jgi:hypothetical protein
VVLSTTRENIEIRYTLDQTDPLATSALYSSPLILHDWAFVQARCFRSGKPVSGIAKREFRPAHPHVANSVELAKLRPGIQYRYFEGAWDSLPNFSKMKPVLDGILKDFTFGTRRQDENFAFAYTGYLLIPETEVYKFFTESDDGSDLYIDLVHVVKNDGLHGAQERSGTISLAKGYHKIRVGYLQRTGTASLKIYVQTQHMTRQVLPKSWLFCY